MEWRDAQRKAEAQWGQYRRPHVLPNMAKILIGLLYGGMDFRKSICTTVMCGGDTDCTAGAVGSIVGVRGGAKSIPSDLVEPLNDRLQSSVVGFHDVGISDIAVQMAEIAMQSQAAQTAEAI
jgi:hypothetical protein